MIRLKPTVAYVAFILLYGSVVARAFFGYSGHAVRYTAYALLAGFLALSFTPPLLGRRFRPYLDFYLCLQSLVLIVLIQLVPHQDYISTLFICLSIQALTFFSVRKGFIWVGGFCLLMAAALALAYGPGEGLLYAPSSLAGCVLIALYIAAMRRLEEEKGRGQTLYAELRKLALQAQELAAAEERNRLARELHDSVTQKLFSLTLTSEAARLIQETEPARVKALLERIQKLAQDSQAEMRALVRKLRPAGAAEEGLLDSLRRHLREREQEDGLRVRLVADEAPDLPAGLEEALFRIVQEALNNTVKHSGADTAEVVLRCGGDTLSLSIEDRGKGFRLPAGGPGAAHFGLSSMRDRARSVGGRLEVESEPGRGTRVRVEVPLARR